MSQYMEVVSTQDLINDISSAVETQALNTKQDKLTAGANITIEDNVISATGGGGATYTAGDNIQISDQNVISATNTTYTAGTNISIDANNEISATNTTYTAGANISIDANNEISATDTTYTAGSNITITNGEISATDTTYSAFTGTDGSSAGTAGLVPAPATTDAGKFLKADGTWATAGGGGGSTTVHIISNFNESEPSTYLDDYQGDLIYVENFGAQEVRALFAYKSSGNGYWYQVSGYNLNSYYPEYISADKFEITYSTYTNKWGCSGSTEQYIGNEIAYIDSLQATASSTKLDQYQGQIIYVKTYFDYNYNTTTIKKFFKYDSTYGVWVECLADLESVTNSYNSKNDYYQGRASIQYGTHSSRTEWYYTSTYKPFVFSVLSGTIDTITNQNKTSLTTAEQVKNYVDGQVTTAMSASY